MEELLATLPFPTFQQFMFVQVALFTALMAILVVVAKNLFHSALSLVGTLFGVAGIYVLLEAEFLAVSQILVYVGGISTLITFAIMLTRSMMYGDTAPINRQAGTAAIIVGTLFSVLAGLVAVIPWPGPADQLQPAIAISDVAAIMAGETSARTLAAEVDFADAEALVVDAEAMLENVLAEEPTVEADVTRAEEDLAEVKAILVETEGRLARALAGEPELADMEGPVVEVDLASAEALVVEAEEALEKVLAEEPTVEADVTKAEADLAEAEDMLAGTVADEPELEVEESVADADATIEEASAPLVIRGAKSDGEVLIAGMGQLFVTTYLVAFELMAVLLLVVLAGAIMLARDRT